MRSLKNTLMMLAFLAVTLTSSAQASMAGAMRENGKIYVVIGVISIIFLLIVIYLVSLDRRLRKAEKERQ